MRYVAVKSEEQQAAAMVFRARDLLVRQRTQTVNAIRGHLAEFGLVAAQGLLSALSRDTLGRGEYHVLQFDMAIYIFFYSAFGNRQNAYKQLYKFKRPNSLDYRDFGDTNIRNSIVFVFWGTMDRKTISATSRWSVHQT